MLEMLIFSNSASTKVAIRLTHHLSQLLEQRKHLNAIMPGDQIPGYHYPLRRFAWQHKYSSYSHALFFSRKLWVLFNILFIPKQRRKWKGGDKNGGGEEALLATNISTVYRTSRSRKKSYIRWFCFSRTIMQIK